MTRLTMELRNEIADKIMAQVPKIDYRDKIKAFLNEQARKMAPPEIMALEGTPLWQYVSMANLYINGEGYYWVCPLPVARGDDRLSHNHPDHIWRELNIAFSNSGLMGANEKQSKAHRAMRSKLMQVMKSTNSVENLRKVLSPDLHQFVPIVVESAANLPVPALVSELKDMGMTFPDTTTVATE
jgi:hypothetical protein